MNCPSCGAANPEGSHFCGECGTALPTTPAPAPPVEPTVPAAAPPPPPPPPPVPPSPPPVPPTEPTPVVPPASPFPPVEPTTQIPTMPAAPPVGGPPPEPPPYVPGPAGGEPPKKKSKAPLVLLGLAVIAALVAGALVLTGGDDDDEAGGGGLVLLEPISQTLADDFAGNLDEDTPSDSIDVALLGAERFGDDVAATLAGRTADGDEVGLFGGSRDVAVCDVEQLIDFLTDEDNADKAEAWAEVEDIDVDDIEDFIRGLTPVRLREDTRVTNHGFRDGRATAIQSILERGTAVLVDDQGVPRVKCNCGNPLLEPEPLGDVDEDDAFDIDSLAQNPDDAWDDFDPEDVVTIEPGDDVDVFILVDIDTGEIFARPVGSNGDDDTDIEDLGDLCEIFTDSPTCGEPPETTTTEGGTTTTGGGETTTTIVLGTGDVQVTLEWGSAADLDLAVTDPNGERVSFGTPGPTSTGGQLDVDSNVGCQANGSVENIFWPPGQAPPGSYTVEVNGFQVDSCQQSGDYTLTIRVTGQEPQVINDSVAENETDTFQFAL